MNRHFHLFAIAALVCLAPAAALAAPAGAPLAARELSAIRGGFEVEGIKFGFGAEVRTFVDGKLALKTTLTWTDKGAVTQRTRGDVGVSIGKAGETPGLNLAGLKGSHGVVITDSSGSTAIAQRLTDGNIQNVVVNNASNRDIRQEVQLNLVLPELAKMQSNIAQQQTAMRFDRSMVASALSAAGH